MTPDPQEQAPDLDVIEKYCDAATDDWGTLNHEKACPNYGYCSPNGCPGHETNVAYDVEGPMLLPDAEPSGDSDEEIAEAFRHANCDATFIVRARTDLPALVKYTRSLQARLAEAERGSKCYCAVCRTAELLKDPPVDSTLP